ncbi:hypothetical protein RND81_08G217400 [Saponaria officinalis]|uniref:RING-type E3 ubiquitin transferase n=1 Tax=Saponaria officinalis TaxID=3572 RepID=A0AAW1JB20_SAPOF
MSSPLTSSPPSPSSSSYWCYTCNRFVRVSDFSPPPPSSAVTCPVCAGGFVQQFDNISLSDTLRRRFPDAVDRPPPVSSSSPRLRRIRHHGGDRSPFNPVIVLRSPSQNMNSDVGGGEEGDGGGGNYELYYDDGGNSGLRPLPTSVSEFLLGSGFDRLLDQLTQIDINGVGRAEQPPASKTAIESMPTISVVETELFCAVCKEAFEVGTEAREMPCKHIYHSDCILPWLNLRNSCPVCRHELPSENVPVTESIRGRNVAESGEDDAMGLTIWRLPGGGFAVGRFSGARRERELPVVYTEMDGGFSNGGVPRRVLWGNRGREIGGRGGSGGGGFMRSFRNLFSCFAGMGVNSSDSISSSSSSRVEFRRTRSSIFGSSSRRNRGFDMGARIRRG